MEAKSSEALPNEPGEWQFEPKWDGFRCLAFKQNGAVELKGKSGTSLGRFFPEVVATLLDAPFERFVVDGELVIELNGRMTFDALQARLHPAASRIRRLSVETPARFILFDMLVGPDGSPRRRSPPDGAAQRTRELRRESRDCRKAHRYAVHARSSASEAMARRFRSRRKRRGHRQEAQRRISERRARDDQGQALADRRLRGWRLSISEQPA